MKTKKETDRSAGLNIVIVASEVHPFAKVGGLADVVFALCRELRHIGHDARIVMPRYTAIDNTKFNVQPCLGTMGVWMGDMEEWCSVFMTTLEGVPVYFIEHQLYFSRDGIYHDNTMADYDDNPRRFGFLSRAALQLCKDIGFKPDIVHAHDWQTALIPAYLKLWHWNDRQLGAAASVLTMHNIAHQGIYPKSHLPYLGLGRHNFTPDKFESFDKINFLKGGIYYADFITTVSPTFAHEITAPFGGFGLAPYLSLRAGAFKGILNGIDETLWNPQTDRLLPSNYSAASLAGKRVCKAHLQKTFDLKADPSIALIGVIGRFVTQKGFDLFAKTIERIVQNMVVQFAILGSGENHLECYFGDLPKRYGTTIGSYIGFDDPRAHLIEAGSDFFLMPSIFEPCGLTQMYSQNYGTLPIVRATGGLDDTVDQYNEATGEGTGFKFRDATEDALYYTVGWAISTYYDRPAHMQKMISTAMSRDFSWKRQAHEYETTYYQALANKKTWDEGHTSYYW
jgi:starch synthase